ncbi:MAG TPA: hypothetical protein VK920_07985 [Solirubrobacterales bacterium]|nr:hypothetical protein [Solirubrobacterales bacterium]
MPPMTGDNTLRCRCGLELRARTDAALDELRARHDGEVCLVLHRGDHWSVREMLRQRELGMADRDELHVLDGD